MFLNKLRSWRIDFQLHVDGEEIYTTFRWHSVRLQNNNNNLSHNYLDGGMYVQSPELMGIWLSIYCGNGYRCYLQPLILLLFAITVIHAYKAAQWIICGILRLVAEYWIWSNVQHINQNVQHPYDKRASGCHINLCDIRSTYCIDPCTLSPLFHRPFLFIR